MLIYHPAFDPHHAIFRMLVLLEQHPERRMPVDQLRILDFYFVFPHILAKVTLTRRAKGWKNRLAEMENAYNRVPAPQMLLSHMQGLQESALVHLSGEGLIEAELLREKKVARTEKKIPDPIPTLILQQPEEDQELVNFLVTEVASIKLTGGNGLKNRTGLLEHRYDPD